MPISWNLDYAQKPVSERWSRSVDPELCTQRAFRTAVALG
jgi:hypothetical protein